MLLRALKHQTTALKSGIASSSSSSLSASARAFTHTAQPLTGLRMDLDDEYNRYIPPPQANLHPASSHSVLRAVHSLNTQITPTSLMYPIFISDKADAKEEIASLPGQYRWGVNRLEELIEPLVAKGLQSVLLFGVVSDDGVKDNYGTFADKETAPVPMALEKLSKSYPGLFLATDVCLCGYTHHGHCGILNKQNELDNVPSINRLAEISVAYAEAGAHMIAPSDMMDGRIGAIKDALFEMEGGHGSRVSVMSYAAKFASAYYGPFRAAACSGTSFGDRSKYQLDIGARGLAMRAVQRDIEEGADVVMVKPGGPYLDIVRDTKEVVDVPVAVYQVSGEYAMLHHAAEMGAFDLQEGVMESLVGMRRAGADLIMTYYTPQVLDWMHPSNQ